MLSTLRSGMVAVRKLDETYVQLVYCENGPRVRYLDTNEEYVVRDDPIREETASRLLARHEYVFRQRVSDS